MRIHCYFGTFYLNKYLELYYFITGIDLMLLRNVCMLLRDALPLNEWNQLREDRDVSASFCVCYCSWRCCCCCLKKMFATLLKTQFKFLAWNSIFLLIWHPFLSHARHYVDQLSNKWCKWWKNEHTNRFNIYIIHKEWQWMPTTERQSIPLFIFHLKLLDWDFTIIILPSNGMIQMKM